MSEQNDKDTVLGCIVLIGIFIAGCMATAATLAVCIGLFVRLVRLIGGLE